MYTEEVQTPIEVLLGTLHIDSIEAELKLRPIPFSRRRGSSAVLPSALLELHSIEPLKKMDKALPKRPCFFGTRRVSTMYSKHRGCHIVDIENKVQFD
jgi:hypothetical protein